MWRKVMHSCHELISSHVFFAIRHQKRKNHSSLILATVHTCLWEIKCVCRNSRFGSELRLDVTHRSVLSHLGYSAGSWSASLVHSYSAQNTKPKPRLLGPSDQIHELIHMVLFCLDFTGMMDKHIFKLVAAILTSFPNNTPRSRCHCC